MPLRGRHPQPRPPGPPDAEGLAAAAAEAGMARLDQMVAELSELGRRLGRGAR